VIKSDNEEPSKSTSWKVLETVMSHLNKKDYDNIKPQSSNLGLDDQDEINTFNTENEKISSCLI